MKKPIAIFDSGVGGLTVVSQIIKRLPNEDIIYFGDTARVPYGIKSPQTIVRFAEEAANFLLRYDPKIIVVACNTASAVAMPKLENTLKVPVCGVVRPGAKAAIQATKNNRVGIIATKATIDSQAYHVSIQELNSKVSVFGKTCPLFVPIVEEGRLPNDPIVKMVVSDYLVFLKKNFIDTLVLGCTHYPLLKQPIQEEMGKEVMVIDSSTETALETEKLLIDNNLTDTSGTPGSYLFYVSDNPDTFMQIGQRFLGRAIKDVFLVAPGDFFPAKG